MASADTQFKPASDMSEALVPAEVSHVGATLIQAPVQFTRDSRTLLCSSGSNVRVISVETGQTLGVLEHSSSVAAVIALSSLRVLTATRDGQLKTWDLRECKALSSWSIKYTVLHAAAANGGLDAIGASDASSALVYFNVNDKIAAEDTSKSSKQRTTADAPSNNQHACRIGSFDVSTGRFQVLHKSRYCLGLVVSPAGDLVASISGRTLFLWSTKQRKLEKLYHVRGLTTLAFHPRDSLIATGDEEGQIILWHGFNSLFDSGPGPGVASDNTTGSSTSSVVTSSMHWHHKAVKALEFSADGAYMLSGGDEAVVVLWQLDTSHHHYIPRLGAPICGISASPSGLCYAASLMNNSIVLINAVSSQVDRAIRGLETAYKPQVGALCRDEHSDVVIVRASEGCLQFYDTSSDQHIARLNVTGRQFVSRTSDTAAAPTLVDKVCVRSRWLITVERRANGLTADTLTLKFWERGASDRFAFSLNSQANDPHSCPVSAIALHPTRDVAVTAGNDGLIKLWRAVSKGTRTPLLATASDKQASKGESSKPEALRWECTAVSKWRDYCVRDASFSSDGSVLAVAYGQVVTLWDALTLTHKTNLVHPTPDEHIWTVFFPGESEYLVSCTDHAIYVWNTLTLAVWYSLRMPVLAMAGESSGGHFAVMTVDPKTSQCCVIVLHVNTPQLLKVHHASDALILRQRCSMTFLQTDRGLRLAYMASDGSITKLEFLQDQSTVDSKVVDRNKSLAVEQSDSALRNSRITPFEKAFGFEQGFQDIHSESKTESQTAPITNGQTPQSGLLDDLLDGPARVLPSIDSLADSFWKVTMQARPSSHKEADVDMQHESKEMTESDQQRKPSAIFLQPADLMEDFWSVHGDKVVASALASDAATAIGDATLRVERKQTVKTEKKRRVDPTTKSRKSKRAESTEEAQATAASAAAESPAVKGKARLKRSKKK